MFIAGGFGIGAFATSAAAQSVTVDLPGLSYHSLDYEGSSTFLTGIRGNTLTGQYVIPGVGNGGLIYSDATNTWTAYPQATADGINLPGAIDNTPYGPSFGSDGGILRVVGSYQTTASSPYDISYLYDSAEPAGSNLTTLQYPGTVRAPTLYTIAHSTFGDQLVGNYDTQLATGNAFIYTISTGTYTTNDKPGAISTTAYGIWGNKIAGGYAEVEPLVDGLAPGHGYIYNQTTNVWTTYDYPGAVETHFEGITGGGRAGTYNLPVDWVDTSGTPHAAVLHIAANGTATWIDIDDLAGGITSANSMYENEVIGVYVNSSGIHGYTVDVPGIYNPIENTGVLATAAVDTPALSGAAGDDILNTGTITTSGASSPGISSDTYGVVTNEGTVAVTGLGSAAVQMNGLEGTLLNDGVLSAAAGGYAINTGPAASGSIVVNDGTINGVVNFNAGALGRFENSGWLGITAAGAGATHSISGTFAQTSEGILALRISASRNDTVQVAGTAELAGTLDLVPQGAGFTPGSKYTVVSASGGLSGGFAGITPLSLGLLDPTLSYSADDAYVTLVQQSVTTVATTPNQTAVATSLDAVFATGGTTAATSTTSTTGTSTATTTTTTTTVPATPASSSVVAVQTAIDELPAADVRGVLNRVSGEAYTGFDSGALSTGAAFTGSITQELARIGNGLTADGRDAQAAGYTGMRVELASTVMEPGMLPAPDQPHWSVWAEGYGASSTMQGDGNSSQLNSTLAGTTIGTDYPVNRDLRLGAAVGYASDNFSVSDSGAQGQTNNAQFAAYGNYAIGDAYIDGTLGYSHADGTITRDVSLVGLPSQSTGTVSGNSVLGSVEAGRDVTLPMALVVTPFVGLQFDAYTQGGLTETGGPLALSVKDSSATSIASALGARLAKTVHLGRLAIATQLELGWAHEFANTTRTATASFAGAPLTPFTVDGAEAGRNHALVGVGVATALVASTSVFVRYDGAIDGSDNVEAISGGLHVMF